MTGPPLPAASTSRDVLDGLRMPLVLMRGDRGIVHANPPAAHLLESGHCVLRARGAVACRDPDSQEAFEAAMAELALSAARAVFPIRGRRGGVLPGVLRAVRHSGRMADKGDGAFVLLAILELDKPCLEIGVLMAGFRLTPAEARIAAAVGCGNSPQECADSLHLKLSTVRSQLVSIYRKMGVASQAQLARRVLPLAIF